MKFLAAAVAVAAAAAIASYATPARATIAPPSAVAAASFVAGKPVTILCDAETTASSSTAFGGWTTVGGTVIHLSALLCARFAPRFKEFPGALGTLIHEAAHARGYRREACAELVADIGVYDVARRFYGMPFFSPFSIRLGIDVMVVTRHKPAAYQPYLTACG